MGKAILSDHKKIGKRFIPPFLDGLGNIRDYSWTDQVLPELIWIACLNRHSGLKRGAELAVALSKESLKQVPESSNWFATVSSYSSLTGSQTDAILAGLKYLSILDELRSGLFPLISLYPKCPLTFLYQEQTLNGPDHDEMLKHFSLLVKDLFNRTSSAATFMQGTALYIGFANDLLTVPEDSFLAKFPRLQDYPHSELSLKIAASVRASMPMITFDQNPPQASDWAKYFWHRGLELIPCNTD